MESKNDCGISFLIPKGPRSSELAAPNLLKKMEDLKVNNEIKVINWFINKYGNIKGDCKNGAGVYIYQTISEIHNVKKRGKNSYLVNDLYVLDLIDVDSYFNDSLNKFNSFLMQRVT